MDILERTCATKSQISNNLLLTRKQRKNDACKNRLVNYLSIMVVDVKASGHREVVMLNRPSMSARA